MQLEVDEGLGAAHAIDGPDAFGQQFEQVVVALAHYLDHHVERPGGQDDVVDLGHLRQLLRDRVEVALGVDADHRLPGEAKLHRIGDRNDLHDPVVDEPLHPLAHRRLGEAHRLADSGVRHPAVSLQLFDDAFGDRVERHGRRVRTAAHALSVVPEASARKPAARGFRWRKVTTRRNRL